MAFHFMDLDVPAVCDTIRSCKPATSLLTLGDRCRICCLELVSRCKNTVATEMITIAIPNNYKLQL
eukprot:6239318-Amphidinium_carterae.1